MINADHSSATQAVSTAIDQSVETTEIVTVEAVSSLDAVLAELGRECEGSCEDNIDGPYEFWGTDLDGVDWRVHVARA